MPIRYQVIASPVISNLLFLGSKQRLDTTVAIEGMPGLRIKLSIAGAPVFPRGMVTIEGERTGYRFASDGTCGQERIEGGALDTIHVTGNGSRISSADLGSFDSWTESPERLQSLIGAWLDAAFVPTPPSAPGGIDEARRVLAAILALPRTGWTASRAVFDSNGDPQVRAEPESIDSPADGVTWLIKDLSQAFRLLRINTGNTAGASTKIFTQVLAANLDVAVPPSTGHQRLAAAAVLRAWSGLKGDDAAERAELVRRVLTGAGIDAPDAEGAMS